jgi:hypothetical protein
LTAFKALLVGNAHFPRDPHGLGALNGPLNDVDALHDELSNADTGIFSCQRPVKDARAQKILDVTEEFFRPIAGTACCSIYSGHGRIDLSGDFYLCAHDTDSRTLASPRVNNSALSKIVRQSPTKGVRWEARAWLLRAIVECAAVDMSSVDIPSVLGKPDARPALRRRAHPRRSGEPG